MVGRTPLMRERPDAQDAARMLAVVLLVMAGTLLLGWLGAPAIVAQVFLQLGFLASPLIYARLTGLRPFSASGFAPLPLRRIVFVLIASLGTFWLLNGLTHLQEMAVRALGLEEKAQAQAEFIRRGIEEAQQQGAAPALALLVLIPPFCEETFFRGLLFRSLQKQFGLALPLAGTTILFALFHPMDVQKVLMLFLGCYFGTLVYLTGSLWASIIAHAVNNLAVLLLMWIFKGNLPEFVGPWWMYLLSALVFGLGMTLLVLDRKQATVPTSLKW